jgi:hypothetical protein
MLSLSYHVQTAPNTKFTRRKGARSNVKIIQAVEREPVPVLDSNLVGELW